MPRCHPRRIPRRPSALLVWLAALATLLPAATGIAHAQVAGETPLARLHRLGLDPNPINVDSLGLTFNPPADAMSQVQRIGERMTVSLVDGGETPLWSMSIQSRTSTLRDPSPAIQMEELLATLDVAKVGYEILHNDPVTYGGRPGQLCFLRQEMPGRGQVVNGWLMLQQTGPQFLIFALQILDPQQLPRLRPLFEASFSTIHALAVDEIVDERKMRLDAGRAFLGSITPERLRSVFFERRWYRYYVPAANSPDGKDKELGYYSVEVREGLLGELKPNRAVAAYDPSERVSGVLVLVRGHYIDQDADMTYDSDARYWMAWDQSEEAFSVLGTSRQGSRTSSEAVTGIRPPQSTGNPSARMTVITSDRDGTNREQKSWLIPQVYMSQVPRWVVGELLAQADAPPQVLSTYCYDTISDTPNISLRIDRWERQVKGPARWTLVSQSRSDAPEVISRYAADGTLLERVWPEGQISMPLELEELHRLWKRKGLPTGGLGR